MKNFLITLLIIVTLVFCGYEFCQQRPKSLEQIDIPQHEFVGELKIIGNNYAKGEAAHLYECKKSYWLRYYDQSGKIKDIIFPKGENRDYNAVRILPNDSCELIRID